MQQTLSCGAPKTNKLVILINLHNLDYINRSHHDALVLTQQNRNGGTDPGAGSKRRGETLTAHQTPFVDGSFRCTKEEEKKRDAAQGRRERNPAWAGRKGGGERRRKPKTDRRASQSCELEGQNSEANKTPLVQIIGSQSSILNIKDFPQQTNRKHGPRKTQ